MSVAARPRVALPALLALSLLLNAWGLDYGLPNIYSWAQDEIIPAEVLEGLEQRFSGGWHSRYPPLHYGLMAAAYGPVRLLSPPVAVSLDSPTYRRLFLTGRLLSLALAAGTAVLLWLCALELLGRAGAACAVLCLTTSPTFVYYAKFANLDVPYLFWYTASLLLLVRFLRTRALRDSVGAACTAALSVATKDQAYALFVLAAPVVVAVVASDRRARPSTPRAGALLLDRRLLLPLAACTLVFAAAHNLPFNPEGFARHVSLIAGDASRGYRMFGPDLAGQAALLALTARLLLFVLGGPTLVLALLGVLIAARHRERRLLFTLLPLVSSQLCFLAVVGYAYDRFLLPHLLVLALFAGRACQAAAAWSAWGPRLAGACVAVVGLLRCVSLDLLLSGDSRYAVERWFRDHVAPTARIAVVGPLEYLPRLPGLRWKRRSELRRAVEAMDPDYVVINADYAGRAEDPRARELYEALASGQAGYRVALRARTRSAWPYRLDEVVRRAGSGLATNLGKINPEIVVYRRTR